MRHRLSKGDFDKAGETDGRPGPRIACGEFAKPTNSRDLMRFPGRGSDSFLEVPKYPYEPAAFDKWTSNDLSKKRPTSSSSSPGYTKPRIGPRPCLTGQVPTGHSQRPADRGCQEHHRRPKGFWEAVDQAAGLLALCGRGVEP